MYIKNMLMLCIIFSHCTIIHPMHLLTRTTPKTILGVIPHKTTVQQKRCFGSEDTEALTVLMIGLGSGFVGLSLIPLGCGIGISYLYKLLKTTQCKHSIYEYIKECSQGKHSILVNEDILEKCDQTPRGRLDLVLKLLETYRDLSSTEKVEKREWSLNQDNPEQLKIIHDTLSSIAKQKQNIFDSVCLLEQDMPNYQAKRETFYAQRIGIDQVSPTIKTCIAESMEPINFYIKAFKDMHSAETEKNNALKYKE